MENITHSSYSNISHLLCVDLCLFLARSIPSELRALIKCFLYQQLTTNKNIQDAVCHWCNQHDHAELVYGHISYWDTSLITNMESLFNERESKLAIFGENGASKTNLNRFKNFNDDISRWDVRNVTTMRGMFKGLDNFNQPLGQWDVRNVMDMTGIINFQRLDMNSNF